MASSYAEAAALLPAGAVWSSSFGNPGEGGYTEYHRTSAGRWRISNGPYDAVGPLVWDVVRDLTAYTVQVDRRGLYWCGLVVWSESPILACEIAERKACLAADGSLNTLGEYFARCVAGLGVPGGASC